jgi:regulator of sigma E protease
MDSDHQHDKDRACLKCISPWKKMLVYFAGPAANLIFVVLLLWTVFFVLGYRDNIPVVGKVAPETPAAETGFLPEDRIQDINGKKIVSWTQAMVAAERSIGRPMRIQVSRPLQGGGEVLPGQQGEAAEQVILETTGEGFSGLFPAEEAIRLRLGPLHAAKKSMEKLAELSKLLFHSVTGLVTAKVSPSELVGPIYLFHVSAQTASESQVSLVYLLAVISACLFFFNLLPLPVLDGGQIVLAMLEKILKRPLAPQSMSLLIHASVVWLVLLIASATLNDIARLLSA